MKHLILSNSSLCYCSVLVTQLLELVLMVALLLVLVLEVVLVLVALLLVLVTLLVRPQWRLLLLHASVQSRVGRTRERRASRPAITLITSASSASFGVYGKGEGVGRDAPTDDPRPTAQCG